LFGLISDIAIDLGTANIRVYVPGKGIVLREPSVIAVSLPDKNVLAIGERAREMLGRTPASITAVYPVVDGAIADFTCTQKMLVYPAQGLRPQPILQASSSSGRRVM